MLPLSAPRGRERPPASLLTRCNGVNGAGALPVPCGQGGDADALRTADELYQDLAGQVDTIRAKYWEHRRTMLAAQRRHGEKQEK
jgi:hypothetical protein